MAFVLQDEHNSGSVHTGYTLPTTVGPNTVIRWGQVFTAGSSYTLSRVGIKFEASTYPKNCTLAIYSTVEGAPSAQLRSETITIEGGIWTYVNFDPTIGLTSGTQYAIVAIQPTTGTTSARYTATVGAYPGGIPYGYLIPANSWTAGGVNLDIFFRTYSDLLVPEKAVTPAPVDTDTGIVLLPTLSWEKG